MLPDGQPRRAAIFIATEFDLSCWLAALKPRENRNQMKADR